MTEKNQVIKLDTQEITSFLAFAQQLQDTIRGEQGVTPTDAAIELDAFCSAQLKKLALALRGKIRRRI
jgi:hypothetical protein